MPKLAAPLTDAKLRALKPQAKPYEVADGARPGLKVEVLPTGSKVWRFRFMLEGKRQKLTIGPASLADARKAADDARELLARGLSPTAAKRASQAKAADEEATVFGFFEHRFIPEHLAQLRSYHRVEALLRRELLPVLGPKPLESVTADDIQMLVDDIRASGRVPTARLVHAWVSSFFELAVDRRRIPANPCRAVKRRRIGAASVRARVMATSEVRAYVEALRTEHPRVQLKHRLGLEAILLSACRRNELVLARREHVTGDTWTIPAENSKNKRARTVPLVGRLREIFDQLLALGSEWLLPADRDPESHIHPEILNSARGRLVADTPSLANLEHFQSHDGRRAFSTWAHERLVHPDVVEACLGHTIAGVRGVYARPQFEQARRQLLADWAEHCNPLEVENNA